MPKHEIHFFNSITRVAPLHFENYYAKDSLEDFSSDSIKRNRRKNQKLSDDYFEWADHLELYSPEQAKAMKKDDYPLLVIFSHRHLEDADLLLLVKFLCYFFTHDNLVDHKVPGLEAINANHTNILLSLPANLSDPYSLSLYLINEKLKALECEGYDFSYFRNNLIDYFSKTSALSLVRTSKQAISEAELINQRLETAGVPQMFEFGLALRKIHLSQHDRENKHLLNACNLANKIIALSNDIASFDAESTDDAESTKVDKTDTTQQTTQKPHRILINPTEDNIKSNLVLYKIYKHGFTRDNAQKYVACMINDALSEFEKSAARVGESEPMQAYVSLMRDWLCGNIEWSKITQRYNLDRTQQFVHEYHGNEHTLLSNVHEETKAFVMS